MSQMKSTLTKMLFAVLVPVIGIPLYEIGYDKMNDSFGGGDEDWAVGLYTIIYVLVFALVPIGLLYSVFKDLH